MMSEEQTLDDVVTCDEVVTSDEVVTRDEVVTCDEVVTSDEVVTCDEVITSDEVITCGAGSKDDSTVNSEENIEKQPDILDEDNPGVQIINEDVVQKLTNGILMQYLPEHDRTKKMIADVIQSQTVLLETIEQENRKFAESQMLKEVASIMERARIYHTKLIRIQKEMMQLHAKSSQLKNRALKLEQIKQREALLRESTREAEKEKERKLTAKLAKPM